MARGPKESRRPLHNRFVNQAQAVSHDKAQTLLCEAGKREKKRPSKDYRRDGRDHKHQDRMTAGEARPPVFSYCPVRELRPAPEPFFQHFGEIRLCSPHSRVHASLLFQKKIFNMVIQLLDESGDITGRQTLAEEIRP
jgi:hypothetical protein